MTDTTAELRARIAEAIHRTYCFVRHCSDTYYRDRSAADAVLPVVASLVATNEAQALSALIVTNPADDHSRAYAAAVAQRDRQRPDTSRGDETSDIQALIEEARSYIHPDSAHALYLIGCLADALEVEVAVHEALRAKVNALADEWERSAKAWDRAGLEIDRSYSKHLRDAARRLRALIVQEDTEKEDQ